jgi:glycosyltransferase involved in cell wall biosynthesis
MNLSVLLPVYGEANFISEAIISTLDNIEVEDKLIVLLDRISDNTKIIIEDFASKDERIMIINSPSPGITSALNLGVTYSDTNFIARMDADDVVINDRFNIQKEFLRSHPEYILIGSNIKLIDSGGKSLGMKFFPSRHHTIKQMLFFYNPIAHPSVMIRRTSLLKSGLYKIGTDGYEDYFLWKKLIHFGKFKNTRKCLLKYRIHDNQTSKYKKNVSVQFNKSYLDFLKPRNKSESRMHELYKKMTEKESKKLIPLLDYNFCKNYFISLIITPKSIVTLSYYYLINAIIAKFYLKLIK